MNPTRPPGISRIALAAAYISTGLAAGLIGIALMWGTVFLTRGADFISAPVILLLTLTIVIVLAWIRFAIAKIEKWKSNRSTNI
jgi:hypothetical protein